MTVPAITVENLSKAYRIGLKEEIPDTIFSAAASVAKAPLKNLRRLRSLDTYSQDGESDDIVWALKDVSFEVPEGEVLGVIGRNGAGKSTLLKILSRITKPTRGRAVIRGRVSSLLEVGTGFHPELSGRENVYMNGTILGMTKREIDRKFDEMVDFSGVEKFLDTPIKRYSSGMKVRLAFAVAAHLEPEILIIDEVLAVGDAEFQRKCLGKMQDVAGQGRTVLFVSHNMNAVARLCHRAARIDSGQLRQIGSSSRVISDHLAASREQYKREAAEQPTANDAVFTRVAIAGAPESVPRKYSEPVEVLLEFDVRSPQAGMIACVHLFDESEQILLAATECDSGMDTPTVYERGYYSATVTIPGNLLNDGQYSIRPSLIVPRVKVVATGQTLPFSIEDPFSRRNATFLGARKGVLSVPLSWNKPHLAQGAGR